ncbi:hypothetical protein K1T71_008578 [Dendrolimus kikuchii]|uniref:Uncharacterized protein n=1 Tax=Dendrolimus kikuchii TaxID=765133 RepID=A0ACC1CVC8_9NEOP|nr:hypothetical protein K1T71_008578 [Dendrolimus kikuchii]
MSEPNEISLIDEETKNDTSPKKRVRHRKKQLYENILKQMEFYFSDANLSKDRFLGEQVKNGPYVPLEVKRTTPLLPYDAETRTLYVESIPVTANREWLERVFSQYGPIAYISMPKFKNSDRIKGYAFIEFSKPEHAQKCLNDFTKMGCKLPTCMPPEELSSIKMFSVEEPLAEGMDNKDEKESKDDKEEYEPPKKKKKNKKPSKGLDLRTDQDVDNEKNIETPTDEVKSITTPIEENKTEIESKDEMSSHGENQDQDTPRKKKNRKRTAKERSRAKHNLSKSEATKGALWGMQVLSKSEWKFLRNKYLNLQRKYMKEMKASLLSKRRAYSSIPDPAKPSVELEAGINTTKQHAKSMAALEKIPGVFVKETLPSPCLDVRLTKRTVRSNIHALHVDAKEGQTNIIIRFDSAQAATEGYRGSHSPAHAVEMRARVFRARSSLFPWGALQTAPRMDQI